MSFHRMMRAYHNWMLKYPSALTSIEQIVNNVKGKRIALFLDYDGTLSPIVDNPDHAFMSNAMRVAVRNVAKCFPTAIISGRSRERVLKKYFVLPILYLNSLVGYLYVSFCYLSSGTQVCRTERTILCLSSCKDVLPIYVGDDKTDEDAFMFLTEGNRGYGILVTPAPKESSAYYSLRDPSEVCVCFITFIA
ncbi:trehalose-phosphate phosphatase A [Helianthus annuus]|uniref:trehalose-phosphate phosphatase A n=1 Tax=Helianthus annuus TaxID=4232 RepID=UPI001652F64D|nr:trehalose-phosphate phosphatase A [Helianthus annuus]